MSTLHLDPPAVPEPGFDAVALNGQGMPAAAPANVAAPERAGVLCWNEHDRVSHASSRLAEMAGSSPTDLLHRAWRSLFGGALDASLPLAAGETRVIELVRRDGSALPVLVTGVFGSAGVGGMALVHDRSAVVHLQETLARTERRFAESQRMANVGSWELEFATGVVTWTDELYRMFGIDPATTASYELFQSILHPEDRDAVVRRIDDAWARGVAIEYDYRVVRPDGVQRFMHSRNQMVHDGAGTPVRLIGTVQDVTDRRLAELALHESETRLLHAQKMEAVGRLAGGVAHDFNNALAAVIGYAQLAALRVDPHDPVREDLDHIRRAGERAATVTRRLLAFSRRQVLAPQRVLLRTAIENLESMLRVLTGESVMIRTKLEEGDAHVFADPAQLEQVIMNLAVNARDAMPMGGILTIATRTVDLDEQRPGGRKGRFVELLVGDTGVGMPPEVRARLFEPFFTTKDARTGTGLGLATVYGIVRQSGGSIEVESEVGLGSRFRILFPLADFTACEADGGSPPAGGHETLLLIEDEPQVRELTRRILERGGYRVLEAGNGLEAMQAATRHLGPIDLIVTDVVMPGLNGRETADRITADRPATRVLYMSGYADDTVVLRAALNGQVPFVQKPFTPDAMMRRVREVLDTPE